MCDEVPIFEMQFLKSTNENSLLICRTLSSAQTMIADEGNLIALVCSDRPVSRSGNIMPGTNIENLTELNLTIADAINATQSKRIVIEILSDVLLRHKAVQTRKWLTELLERLRSKGITSLAVINPGMHAQTETTAILDVFDGNLEIIETPAENEPMKAIQVKRMKGLEVYERTIPLALSTLTAFPIRKPKLRPLSNLPAPPTPLIGREKELTLASPLLVRKQTRLLTLTGPGGSGKTRLALEIASRLTDNFPNGIFFVTLESVRDTNLVLPTIAATLGVKEAGGRPLSDSLKDFLHEKQMLLVLDNFEQVVAAAPVVAELLAACPEIAILVTSRAPLQVRGESEFPVPPLALPDLNHLPTPENLSQYGAVQLFIQRALAVKPDFAVSNVNAPAVAEICHRLDGLPLAIELAAARIRLFPPPAILAQLEKRLKLLTGGARDLPARQRTLGDTIAWSYDLLNEEEKTLFRRLSVFSGGCSMQATEAVCNADRTLDILNGAESLVAKNLLRMDAAKDEPRLVMLETIREYGIESLRESGEFEEIRHRFVQFFLDIAERAYRERNESTSECLSLLEKEQDNLRQALDWANCLGSEIELQLAGALGWFWVDRPQETEARGRLGKALANSTGSGIIRARAVRDLGTLLDRQRDISGRRFLEESVTISREVGDLYEIMDSVVSLGWSYLRKGDDATALRFMEEALDLARKTGNSRIIDDGVLDVCQILVSQEQVDRVRPLANEVLAKAISLKDLRTQSSAHHYLGDCGLIEGDLQAAFQHYSRTLTICFEIGDMFQASTEMEGVAMALAGMGFATLAIRLAGAAAGCRQKLDPSAAPPSSLYPFWNKLINKYLGRAREEVGRQASLAAWNEGLHMDFELATKYALNPEKDKDPNQ